MTAPRFDRVSLVNRIQAEQTEIDALTAKLAVREAEFRRLVRQLGRLPDDAPDTAVAPPRRGVEIGIAARRVGRSVDTLIRRGKPLGWAWKVGGRWEVDLAAVDAWKAGLAARWEGWRGSRKIGKPLACARARHYGFCGFCRETADQPAGQCPAMTKPPPSLSNADLAAARRLNVRVPVNLGLAVRLAADARKVPVADFVRDALLDRLDRDATPAISKPRVVR